MKKAAISTIVLLVLFSIAIGGCLQPEEGETNTNQIKITDSAGRNLTIEQPVEKVVTLTGDSAEVTRALAATDKIVGKSMFMTGEYWSNLSNVSVVGSSMTGANVEKIVEINPDVVITYTAFNEDLEDELKPFNITVLRLDFYKSQTMKTEIEKLGKVLDKEEQAQELINFYDKYEQRITEKVENIPSDERVDVYVEGLHKYDTASSDSGWHQQIVLAGGNNIAADLEKERPDVSSEWVLEQDPDAVVKVTGDALGYSIENNTLAKNLKEGMENRSGWKTLSATKNDRIYLVSNELISGLRYPVGTAYVAKNLYPDRFQDLDPNEIHKKYLQEFQGIEYEGRWFYPSK
ncbi:MAG: ABC-type Fe(3+)-hydroxamate transport system periplasmic component [Candidatus Methanohalarchaeum thermophilum]|uniref:ABC-type Fe(3+)-hydroxamate transport system periplasmic component n=1 Tax=Methanohalarchaeum thermophilum TaxID=1903181 RepID=A0A1Q6DVU7_METT1|nr:MAG: ABC-type Fe(3+)-hydroxamate transport system periplasmic component [Candidatus Methanohalarchaeum thermophilum]